jgi:predicted amidohydrolase
MELTVKVGYFHFGKDHGTPMEALRCELNKQAKEKLADTLLVLPEAFNIGKCYCDSSVPDNSQAGILDLLKAEAQARSITFVAGLILESNGVTRNSAYFIGGADSFPMCHKMVPDGIGRYAVCAENCDVHNPLPHRGGLVGCLICADSDPPQNRSYLEVRPDLRRWERIVGLMRAEQSKPVIFCVPAHPHTLKGAGAPSAWPEFLVVFASSCMKPDYGSSIGDHGHLVVEADGPINVVDIAGIKVTIPDLGTSDVSPSGS